MFAVLTRAAAAVLAAMAVLSRVAVVVMTLLESVARDTVMACPDTDTDRVALATPGSTSSMLVSLPPAPGAVEVQVIALLLPTAPVKSEAWTAA